jgi:hypothetical protein
MFPASLSIPVLCLWVRPGAYPRVEHLKGFLLGQAPDLLTIIVLGFKGLQGTEALAYFSSLSVTKKKDL